MRQNCILLKTLAATAVVLGIGSAHAQSGPPEDYPMFNDTELSAFSFNNPAGTQWYKGTFTYNGVSYNPQENVNFDLTTLENAYNYFINDANADPVTKNGRVIYVFYKQQYSAVVGNIVKGDEDRSFVKEVAGVLSDSDALPTSDSYTYTGKVFNHIPGTEGTITYTISADGAEWAGSGSVAGITGKRPPVAGDNGEFTINGELLRADITVVEGKVVPATGAATLILTTSAGNEELGGVQYDVGVYGPNAEEIAGSIYGGDLLEKLNNYGFAASRQ